MSLTKSSFAASALMVALAAAQEGVIHVNPQTRFLEDGENRSVLFHGVNVVYKVPPYIPTTDGAFDIADSLNDEDIQNLVDWGQNFVRLGVMWEAVERTEGVYDMAYLGKVRDLIEKLGNAGIYTLIDAHQDVLARAFCGEGIPDFYAKRAAGDDPVCIHPYIDELLKPLYHKYGVCVNMDDYNYKKDENGDPLISECNKESFVTYYTSPQTLQAFKSLYENKDGLRDKFADFWDVVSKYFANHPYVVGYDPMNEPGNGNPFQDYTLVIPGEQDRRQLAPLWEAAFERYYKNSENSIMWFEPSVFPDETLFMGGLVFPAGFDRLPGGDLPTHSPNHVFNDHTYCCQLALDMCETGEPRMDRADLCLEWHDKRIGTRAADAERYGVPLMITEFGACLTEGPCFQEITQVGDVCDKYLVGWAYWEFKTYEDLTTTAQTGSEGFYNQDGSLQHYKVKALARTYMQAIQGVPTEQKFDSDNARFYATWTVNTSIGKPTRIYTNREYWYPDGYDVKVEGVQPNGFTVDLSNPRYVEILVTDRAYNKVTVKALITRKDAVLTQ